MSGPLSVTFTGLTAVTVSIQKNWLQRLPDRQIETLIQILNKIHKCKIALLSVNIDKIIDILFVIHF